MLDFIFQDIQLLCAILFVIFLGLFLWFKRDKVDFQKWLFPIIYSFLYRTKIGLENMNKLAKKFPRFLKFLSYFGVFIGFLGMIFTMFILITNLYKILFEGMRIGAGIVQPFVQTEPGSIFFYIQLNGLTVGLSFTNSIKIPLTFQRF